MTAWTDLGLPCPSRDGYGYTRDMGLLRTPFATAQPEQRQAQTEHPLTFTLSWMLTGAQLAIAEPYLLANGYAGMELDIISGASPDGLPALHAVRLTKDYEVTAVRPGLYRLAIQAETLTAVTPCLPATCDAVDPDDGLCDPLVEYSSIVQKTNAYAIYHGTDGPGTVIKISLAVIYDAAGWNVTVSKANLYGVYHGNPGTGNTSKANLYAIINTLG